MLAYINEVPKITKFINLCCIHYKLKRILRMECGDQGSSEEMNLKKFYLWWKKICVSSYFWMFLIPVDVIKYVICACVIFKEKVPSLSLPFVCNKKQHIVGSNTFDTLEHVFKILQTKINITPTFLLAITVKEWLNVKEP